MQLRGEALNKPVSSFLHDLELRPIAAPACPCTIAGLAIEKPEPASPAVSAAASIGAKGRTIFDALMISDLSSDSARWGQGLIQVIGMAEG